MRFAGAGVGVGVALGAGVGVGVALGAGVGVGVALGAGVGVGVALGAGVGVGVALGAGVGVGVALGAGGRQGRDRAVGRDGHVAGRVLGDGPEVVGGTRCQVTQRLDMGGVVEARFLGRPRAERRRGAVLELTRGRLIERPRHSRRRRGHIRDFDAHERRLRRVFRRRFVRRRFRCRGAALRGEGHVTRDLAVAGLVGAHDGVVVLGPGLQTLRAS